MTLEEVQSRVDKIRDLSRDFEAAHSEEDELYADILALVADEAPEPFASLARLALTTEDFDFPRYCA